MSKTVIATETQMEEVYFLNKKAKGEEPSYYATIPAPVRYDKNLKPMEKLMYGEISSLSNKWGFCIAGNTYFAKLYEVDKATVSRWIANLEKRGYIERQEIRNEKKQVVQRRIFMKDITVIARQRMLEEQAKKSLATPIDEKINTPLLTKKSTPPVDEKINTPIDEKVKDNIIPSFNKKIEEEDDNIKEITDASLGSSFDNIKSTYYAITGKKPTQYALSKLKAVFREYPASLIMRALKESGEATKPLNYMETTLADWKEKNLHTIEDVEAYMNKYKEEKKKQSEKSKAKATTNKKSKAKKQQKPDAKAEERKQFNESAGQQSAGITGYNGDWISDMMNGTLDIDKLFSDNDTTEVAEVIETETEVEAIEPATQENPYYTIEVLEVQRLAKERNPHLTDAYIQSLTPEKYEFFVSMGMLK